MKRIGPLSKRTILNGGILMWLLSSLLVLLFVFDPYAAPTLAPLKSHSALIRDGGIARDIAVVGHRGAAADAPENTLASFRLAIAAGADFIETDVRLTKDGVAVLMHDETVDRTTNGSGPLASFALRQLRKLDAGAWFSPEFTREKVPTLEQLTKLIGSGETRAFIEFKGDWASENVGEALALLRARHLTKRVMLASFEPATLNALRTQAPDFAKILLTRDIDQGTIDYALELGVSAVCARDTLFVQNPAVLRKLQHAGIAVAAYTLNTPEQWQQASTLGIDFFVTDDPVGLIEWIDARVP